MPIVSLPISTGDANNPATAGSSLVENLALALVRLIAGAYLARLSFRFAHRLYPATEPRHRTRRLRLYLRTVFYLKATKPWFTMIDRHAVLRRCLRLEPDMAEKLHRPYRRSRFDSEQRAALAFDHVRIVDRLGLGDLVADAYAIPVAVACFNDRNGKPLRIELARPARFEKEGDIAVHLVEGDQRIYSACFSFRTTPSGGHEIDVGCIQGPTMDDAREYIRTLTRRLHGLRPRSIILESLRAIAVATGAEGLRIVGNAGHIYTHLRKRKALHFDYDQYCEEAGGTRNHDGDWHLPAKVDPRPIDQVPAKKRAETIRKRALVDSVSAMIDLALCAKRKHP